MSRSPKQLEVKSFVNEGQLTRNRQLIKEAVEQFEGKEVTVIIKRAFNQRSNNQNAYYFGVIVEHWIKIIREEWGEIWNKDETHEFLKSNLNYEEYVNEDTGEMLLNPETNVPIRKPKSTRENTTVSQEDYHKACRDLAWSMFNYQIPLPEHQLKALY